VEFGFWNFWTSVVFQIFEAIVKRIDRRSTIFQIKNSLILGDDNHLVQEWKG